MLVEVMESGWVVSKSRRGAVSKSHCCRLFKVSLVQTPLIRTL